MYVSNVELENFRNYRQLSICLSQGFTLIHGENGQGKTNLIEALVLVSHHESHRSSGLKDLIANNQQTARVGIGVIAGERKIFAGVELARHESNKYFLNRNKVSRAIDLAGALRVVAFSPEDLDIVRRDPSDRRRFLDQVLVQMSPKLASEKANYDRVLKQRNALLKSARFGGSEVTSTMEIWNDQLIDAGTQLIWHRADLVSRLQPRLRSFYQNLSGRDQELSISLKSSIHGWVEDQTDTHNSASSTESPDLGYAARFQEPDQVRADFRSSLFAAHNRELERGITLVGPHRDELAINLDGGAAKTQASQGEAWSIALGLKLSVADIYRETSTTGDPVVVLDDVFSVLDAGRRARLMEYSAEYEQVLVTSASPETAPQAEWASVLRVDSGEVSVDG